MFRGLRASAWRHLKRRAAHDSLSPAMRHHLSDVMLAEALEDRAGFRHFCGFAREEETAERTAFVRFAACLLRTVSPKACLKRSRAISK
jgi:Transposase domain (DUF772)